MGMTVALSLAGLLALVEQVVSWAATTSVQPTVLAVAGVLIAVGRAGDELRGLRGSVLSPVERVARIDMREAYPPQRDW